MKTPRHFRRSLLGAAVLIALSSPAFAASYTFNSGNYAPGTTAPDPLGASDVLNIGAGGSKFFSSVTLNNGGTVNWSADTLYLSSSAINNSGLWNASSDDSLSYYSGNQSTFVNSGTFRKSAGTGATNIGNVAFTNSGTLDAQTGSIVFGGGNTSFLAGTQFTGAGVVAITNNASFSGAFTSANLALQGGTFTGSSAVVNGTVNFSGGQMAGDWTVAGGQQLLLQSGASKFIASGSLNNQGTVRWLGGGDNLYLSSASINNANLFDVQGNLSLSYYSGNQPSFTNSGTVQVAAGNTLTVGNIAFVNNGGILKTDTGATINFTGSNTTFNAGTKFNGAGTTLVSSDARFIGDFTSQNLVLQSGNFYGGDGVTAGSGVALKGAVAFNGGTLQGNWNIGSGNTLTMNAGSSKFIANAAVVNAGTMTWAGGADNLYLSSASISNSGLFSVQGDLSLTYYSGNQPVFTNASTGTLQVAAGHTLTVGGIALVNNGGTLSAGSGATINYAGGNATFNAGTLFGGAGTHLVTSNASFIGNFTAQNLLLQGGTFTGGDGVTPGTTGNAGAALNGAMAFNGGTLVGNWNIGSGNTLTMNAGSSKFIANAAVVNAGTMTWAGGADNLYLSSASISNSGLFAVQGDLSLTYYSGNQPVFTNASTGTLQVAAGHTLTVGGIALVNNGGTLSAGSGATINYAGGNATFNAGTLFGGAGTHLVTSNASFIGNFTAQNLLLQGGTFTGGDGVTPGSTAVLNGNVAYTGGTLTGNWQVASGQALVAQDGTGKFISNATLINQGTVTWKTADTMYLASSTIVNQGKFDLKSDAQLNYYSGNQPAFVNSGLLVKSAGTGTSDMSTLAVTNTGTIEVQTGTIHLPDSFANAGTLKGNGTLQSATLTNNGHVAPGSGIGTLTLAGNYVQGSTGFLDSELQNKLSTDLFLVTGNATLGGTLALHCFASCQFAVGDEVVLLDATGSLNGTFANVTLDGFATGAFNVVYDTANGRVLLDVTQGVTAAVPEPQSWAMLLAGLGALGFVARRRRAD